MKHLTLIAIVAVAFAAAPHAVAEGGDAANGAEIFATCVPCHGADGQGRAVGKGPAIAGLPQWYVEGQLGKFQSGGRGAHPDDHEGLRMRPMSRSLMNRDGVVKSRVQDVAAYVASLPKASPAHTVDGDAEVGKSLYTPCIACHGPAGGGNPALNAPPLVGLNDWYLVQSIEKIQAGISGGNAAKDPTGALMRPMAMTLTDAKKVKDVVAYIRTLGAN